MDRSVLLMWAGAIAIVAMVVSYHFVRLSERFARVFGVIDAPTGGRKIHSTPIPLWGGVGIAAALLVIVSGFFSVMTSLDVRPIQLLGYLIGISFLLLGGALDDFRPLPARVQVIFPILAAVSVIVTGTGILRITNPLEGGVLSLISDQSTLPSDILTFVWIMVATYAMKILDGMDGLVTGMTVISAGIVGALSASTAYYLPSVVMLSSAVGGAYAGFLPRNINPAKQFLGEAGSTIAGFSIAVLAILSGAKIAMTLTVLAIPITDIFLVIFGRIRRGAAWYKGDATHLHHRLLQIGIPQRVAVALYWSVSLVAGIFALSLQTQGKIFLISFLCLLAALTSFVAGLRAKK